MSDSSDDGGLQHITLQRARPVRGRRLAQGVRLQRHEVLGEDAPAEPPQPAPPAEPPSTPCQGDSDTDSSEGVAASVGGGSIVRAPLFRRGECVTYVSQAGEYAATVVAVDTTVAPPSYTVAFADGSERSTEEHNLRPPPQQQHLQQYCFSPGDVVDYCSSVGLHRGVVMRTASASPPSYCVCFTDGVEQVVEEQHLQEVQPAQEEEVRGADATTPTSSSPAGTADPEPKGKKEKREKKDKREQQQQRQPQQEPEATAATPATDTKEAKQKKPRPVNASPAMQKVVPNTRIYTAMVVDKISNRGFRHKRLMVCTSIFVIFTKEDGEVRRVVELRHLDSILVQDSPSGLRVVLQLTRGSGEPDVMFAVRREKKPDPRNSHPTPHEALEVIRKVCEAVPPHRRVPITAVTVSTDLKLLIRNDEEIEKPDPRRKLDEIVEKSAASVDSGDEPSFRPPGNANDMPLVSEEGAPQWRPDSEVQECEGCSKSFNLIRRRHHCRACGGVFCGSCSASKSIIPKLGPTEARVCGSCLKSLSA